MAIIEQNMSLGQLRLERARLQALFWKKADELQQVSSHPETEQLVFIEVMAIGEHLEIINAELDNRNYDHASKIRVVNFRPELSNP